MTETNETQIQDAKQSFTGKTLTQSQFDEAWALSDIMAREIRKSGSFKEKLTDYSHAFARSEKFDQMKGETIIRDIFSARHGQTMNQMREGLMEREAVVRESASDQALHHARSVPEMIKSGETMAFYKAYDAAAVNMARQHGITETGAKTLMKDAFREAEGSELYDVGKEREAEFHTPKRAAERADRAVQKERGQTRTGPQM